MFQAIAGAIGAISGVVGEFAKAEAIKTNAAWASLAAQQTSFNLTQTEKIRGYSQNSLVWGLVVIVLIAGVFFTIIKFKE